MENDAETVLPLLPSEVKTREKKIGKHRAMKEKEKMERRGVTTLTETFQQAGGPLKTLAKQRFVINLVKRFSSYSSLSPSLLLFFSLEPQVH